ncbi:MAG: hypothetical protein DLM67_00850 [Candidatus Nephthysia bennettiae]|uniref:PLL-like beta propeller domain-containing protein n=1 Tax=Candidatus Nephthysia bennettiae TaxID=3127016 RepID=A0A934KBA1_9BACT|nr:hypothetical protein [Candidatus Dormibacteraeota bacterium]MBJ7614650.1 hypothetical protein [Candidatus Dormibacteraeota bacterium]PZS00665.1 MAG: hypothetical protein DLM67_00850 [Candidatus Dormibacteraeota bacterium]
MLGSTLKRTLGGLAAAASAIGLAVAATPTNALAVSPAETPTKVGVEGIDGGLYAKQDLHPFTPSVGFGGLGGVLTAAPAVASIPDRNGLLPGQPLYIATGSDHALWVRSDTLGWQRLTNDFIYCIDNPAAVVVSAHAAGQQLLVVGCQGSDHALYYAFETVGRGSLPSQSLHFQSLGGVLLSGPAVAAVDPNHSPGVFEELTFFANGTDGHVYTRTPTSGWTRMPWQCLGHPAAGGSLSSFNPSAYTEIAVFGCQGTDRQLWTARNIGAGWEQPLPWGGTLVDGPGIAVTPTWVTVYAEGTDAQLYQLSFSPQNFTGWLPQGGILQHGAGAAALLYGGDNP